MKLKEIANIRLANQQITASACNTPGALVAYMGAIQAQDYVMSKLAIGLRVPGATEASVEAALEEGSILRTHVMRPTWHYVSADDIYWMLELTAPRIKQAISSMDKVLGLTDDLYKKSKKIFAKALEGGKHLTRAELTSLLEKAKIDTSENRPAHLIMDAEINGLLCSGRKKENQRTYALLEERVAKKKTLTKEEALAELAGRYLNSHGPATVKDFIWWSGLTAGDAKRAIESVRHKFESELIDGDHFFFADTSSKFPGSKSSVFLLPAFDEFLISYKDRTASLQQIHNRRIVTINGIFRPALVVNGQVAGLWKMSTVREGISINVEGFGPVSTPVQRQIKKTAEAISAFYQKHTAVTITTTN